MIGHLFAEAALFPMETILHRIHLQGCRTIIDNLDTGREVIPIMTRYWEFKDSIPVKKMFYGDSSIGTRVSSTVLEQF